MARDRECVWMVCLCILGLLVLPVHADLIAPAITHVYFEKDGAPYNGSVQYSVNCYGYSYSYPPVIKSAGSYQPELVFHYSASSDGYGSAIYQPYYLRYTHIDWCDLEGNTNNQTFNIENFSTLPYTRCDGVPDRVAKTWGDRQEYYYDTPEYFACRQFETNYDKTIWADRLNFANTISINSTMILLLRGTSPLYETQEWSHTIIDKSDIDMDLDEYIQYLETCDPVTDRNCPGWIINGMPLKTFTEYRPLKNNATDLKEHPCDTFLVKADPSLIMPFTDEDPWHHPCVSDCNYTMDICELRSAIPSGTGNITVSGNVFSALAEMPVAESSGRNLTYGQQPALPPVHRGPVELLYCSILSFFGVSC